jgi:hypothetical protein
MIIICKIYERERQIIKYLQISKDSEFKNKRENWLVIEAWKFCE